jgi:DDE superfamily endonuclease
MATWNLPPQVSTWIEPLSQVLHAKHAWRLLPLVTGMLFAQGRRTVASWLRAGGLGQDYEQFYYFIGAVGCQTQRIASWLLRLVVSEILPGDDVLLFALDDTPTKRAGPKVEGAGIHHNPTPGPADQKFLYGHIWVTLARIVRHPHWGVIGLPLRALLYIRAQDIEKLPPGRRVPFQTKLEQAAQLVTWIADWLRFLDKRIWVVADGAYAKRPFLKAACQAGVVVISRLRKDAALRTVPSASTGCRQRGRPRKYGAQSISLAKRAGHRQGWLEATYNLYGQETTKTYKTFLATYEPAGGLIRVVLIKEERGWVAFFCTDSNASVESILKAVADRSAIEQDFHDLKEVHGAGQQQVRNLWCNIGAFHLNLWLHTLIELWAWQQPAKRLRDRSDSPWDNPERRPSHADRRNALRRACLQQAFSSCQLGLPTHRKSQRLVRALLKLVA